MREMIVEAKQDNLPKVFDFIHSYIACFCNEKYLLLIDLAVEEIFINISHYAYSPKIGKVQIKCVYDPPKVILSFTDSGKPYDPVKQKDPDIMQNLDKREAGGLGIFMVKNIMDDVKYWYHNGENNLEITKIMR